MTCISIPGPKHTFLLVAMKPESSNFEKKCKWSFSSGMSVTGSSVVVVQQSASRKVLGSILCNALSQNQSPGEEIVFHAQRKPLEDECTYESRQKSIANMKIGLYFGQP